MLQEILFLLSNAVGAVDEGAVFNKSIYECLANEIHPQNALRAKKVSSKNFDREMHALILVFQMQLKSHLFSKRRESRDYVLAHSYSSFFETHLYLSKKIIIIIETHL